MKAKAYISGSLVWQGEIDGVPPVGTMIIFPMQSYKKGLWPGSILRFQVTTDVPPTVDLVDDEPVLILDVDGWTVLEEAPAPPGEERE